MTLQTFGHIVRFLTARAVSLPIVFACLLAGNAFAADPCLECHEKKTPGIVEYWRKSVHSAKKIWCIDCHGSDVEANHARGVTVEASKCGACHKQAFTEHRLSKHGIGLKAGKGCTRNMDKTPEQEKSCLFCHKPGSAEPLVNVDCAMFLAQSPEMQRQGCSACHIVEVRCDTCHTKHGTDLEHARTPGTCGVCHMGPDHPQMEMWEYSIHGVIYEHGDRKTAPSCVTCHMQKGTHNVSRGISSGLPKEAEAQKKKERDFMIGICSGCHTSGLAARNLADADRIEKQGRELVEEGRKIIEGLQKEGLLSPSPADRPQHPIFGSTFVIGPHMLYENLSTVESLFFRLRQFYFISSYKGVFHQNPDYAHWFGNAPMKLTLSEIRSEAALLRQVNTLKRRLDNLSPISSSVSEEAEEIRKRLRDLNEKKLRGEITEQEYEKGRGKILDERGL